MERPADQECMVQWKSISGRHTDGDEDSPFINKLIGFDPDQKRKWNDSRPDMDAISLCFIRDDVKFMNKYDP